MRNKPHKQKFASKHELARRAGGNGGRPTEEKKVLFGQRKTVAVGKGGNEAGNKERQQASASALRKLKAEASLAEKAIGSRALGGPPRVVAFVPLNESANPHACRADFYRACDTEPPAENCGHVGTARHRFTTVLCPELEVQAMLDTLKVTDVVVFTVDCSMAVQETIKDLNTQPLPDTMSEYSGTTWFADLGLCITDATRELLHVANAQACPAAVVVLQGLDTYASDKARRHTVRIHERYFTSMLADGCKVLVAGADDHAQQLIRCVANMKLRHLKWREQRPYLLVDDRQYDAESGVLEVRGFLRGAPASASMLFHLTNYGTYRAQEILAPGDPTGMGPANEPLGVLDVADGDIQESLEGIQQNDTAFDENHEFPTEADVAFEEQQKKTVWVPEGVSEYQAAWYDGDHDGAAAAVTGLDHHQHIGGHNFAQQQFNVDTKSHASSRTDAMLLNAADVIRHEQLTDEERLAERQQLLEDCEDEERHADEVDTPVDIPARQRFSKYRAMKSFSTSQWDPKENLPLEYASIFELAGYAKIRQDAVAEVDQAAVPTGTYVSIRLEGVPEAAAACELLLCSGQLRHEQKWSVMHCHVQRSSEFLEPIKSKTPMMIHMGFRKVIAEPIYSDAVVGNRSKFARYFLPGEKFRIATFYAPIAYHPTPVLMFEGPSIQQIRQKAPLRLALFGSVLPPNPNFLVLKRVVLTGRIATIYKKVLVVKFMFFNEDDVKWFMPVDLWTRLGRQGRIIKAVGTHGMFKASFNDTVFQHDMICMTLWKRVFPKWRTVLYNEADLGQGEGEGERDSDNDE
jgi:pre-rRNA-processing protein TSR1